jgi:Domain of Unknown Function (DUF1080)
MSSFNQTPDVVYCPRCKTALFPGRTYCSFCGLWIAQALPVMSPQPLQPSFEPNIEKVQSLSRYGPALIYSTSALLLVVVCALSLFYFVGIYPLSLFSSRVSPPKVSTYALPKGTPLFVDNFTSDANGWNLQSSPGNYRVTLGNGKLGIQIEKHNLLWELLPGERTFSNFTLAVRADLSQGDQNDGYGVYIRGTSDQMTDLASYYRFELYGDGSYAIFKGMNDAGGNSMATKIVNYTLNPAIKKRGEVNQIMIIAKGSTLSLVVNGQLLKVINDASFSSGSIALFVSNLLQSKPGAQAQFSQFAIYPAG